MKCPFMCFSNIAVHNVVDLLSTAANYMDPTVWLSDLLIGTINYHYSRDKNVQNQSIVHNVCVLAVHPTLIKLFSIGFFI
jgi:hypothetical protein